MRQLLVFGKKTFKISIPDDAKITFGPWSPPSAKGNWEEGAKKGTLRIYQGNKENIIACFSNVDGFRDLSLQYAEEVAKEERGVPFDSRLEIVTAGTEDGAAIGHLFIPVGRHCHEAANRIIDLQTRLSVLLIAASKVLVYHWQDNDDDAAKAIDVLRSAVEKSQS